MVDDQAQISFACVLSLEEEQKKKVLPSEKKIQAEAQKCSHRDKAEKVRALEDLIKRITEHLCIFLLRLFIFL